MSERFEFIKWIVDVLFVGGVLFVIIDRIKFRHENKSLKKNEVTGSDLDNETKRLDNETKKLDNDQKQIDIGSLFLEKMRVAAEVVEQASMKMGEWNQRLSVIEGNQNRMESNQNHMMKQFEGLTTEVAGLRDELAEVKVEQNMERTFLNGTYEKERQRMLAESNLVIPSSNPVSAAANVSPEHVGAVAKLTPKPSKKTTNGSKTKKSPVPRKRGWNPDKTRDQSSVL